MHEGIDPRRIHVTGNTVIDALLKTAARDYPLGVALDPRKRLVLVTVHRRDSFGEPLEQICQAIAQLHEQHPEVEFLWPVHPNPAVKSVVETQMRGLDRVHLCPPMEYGPFVSAIKRAAFVLSDSGGVQEEAPALGTPVLVLRNESECARSTRAGRRQAGRPRPTGHHP